MNTIAALTATIFLAGCQGSLYGEQWTQDKERPTCLRYGQTAARVCLNNDPHSSAMFRIYGHFEDEFRGAPCFFDLSWCQDRAITDLGAHHKAAQDFARAIQAEGNP